MIEQAYAGVTAVLSELSEADLMRPTRCAGWVVVDVVTHLRMDAERALIACATPVSGPPAVDAAGYVSRWNQTVDGASDAHGMRFVRVAASAYRTLDGVRAHWRDTTEAAARAVHAATGVLATQGTSLAASEFERTLVLEAVVHHLDLIPHLASAPPPDPACLAMAHDLLGELAGAPLPTDDPAGWVLRAAGRLPAPAPWDTRLPVLR